MQTAKEKEDEEAQQMIHTRRKQLLQQPSSEKRFSYETRGPRYACTCHTKNRGSDHEEDHNELLEDGPRGQTADGNEEECETLFPKTTQARRE